MNESPKSRLTDTAIGVLALECLSKEIIGTTRQTITSLPPLQLTGVDTFIDEASLELSPRHFSDRFLLPAAAAIGNYLREHGMNERSTTEFFELSIDPDPAHIERKYYRVVDSATGISCRVGFDKAEENGDIPFRLEIAYRVIPPECKGFVLHI